MRTFIAEKSLYRSGLQTENCRFEFCYNSEGGKPSGPSGRDVFGSWYYLDPDTGQPHIYGHGVTESEVEEVLRGRGEDLRATGDSRRKIGQTLVGRYLRSSTCPTRIRRAYS